jgi:cell division protein FtsI (penicillin-binding protein 3)
MASPPQPSSSSRRTTLALSLVLLVVVVLVVRLVDIQVVRAAALTEEAAGRRAVSLPVRGDRGPILDRDGRALATSVVRYDVTAAPVLADTAVLERDGARASVSVDEALDEIAEATGASSAALRDALDADPGADFASLVEGVDVDVYRAVRALGIPWVYFERHSARSYPNGAVAGNLTGFIGTDGPQAGLELTEDSCLGGSDGRETFERGADGVRLPGSTVVEAEPRPGSALTLTIDRDLQYLAQQALAEQGTALRAESGTVVVMDARTGELLTVADWPSVDPNDVDGTPAGDLGSKAFTDSYEPGSTFKAITAAALLDQGAADPASRVTAADSRSFPWGGRIKDAAPHPTRQLTLTGVLRDSSNVGTTLLGERLSAATRHDYMTRFGLDAPTEVGFLGEPTAGIRPASEWDRQTDVNTMFGQGVSTTAVHVASIFQTLANHGVRLPVSLVAGCGDGASVAGEPAEGTRVVSAAAADTTLGMLEHVVTDGDLSEALTLPGYRVAAKSGTAEVALPDGRGYGSDFIVSVAGVAPADDPRFVVVATFTKPQAAKTSAAAAPTFSRVMAEALHLDAVPPSTEPATPYPMTW